MAGVLALLCLLSSGVARADRIDDLTRSLEQDKDEKTRISAVVALGSLKDPRVVPALIRALEDKSAVVRGLAASALGHQGDASAIDALENVLSDDNGAVRSRARDALKALRDKPATTTTTTTTSNKPATTTTTVKPATTVTTDGGGKAKVYVIVKTMANKTNQGGKELAKQMRDTVVHELESSPELTLDANVGGKLTQFVVDGAISKVTRGTNGPWVEVTCEVKLTVSSAEGRIMSIVTGSATVQVPRGSFKASMEKSMQGEAVENAVRGAHQNLYGFLTRQVATK